MYTGRNTVRANLNDENTLLVEVNLDNVRALYPALNTDDGNAMKFIGQQLIEGIKVDRKGALLIDQRKVNPNFLTIRKNTLQQQFQDLPRTDQ